MRLQPEHRWYWIEQDVKEDFHREMALLDCVKWDTEIMQEGALA